MTERAASPPPGAGAPGPRPRLQGRRPRSLIRADLIQASDQLVDIVRQVRGAQAFPLAIRKVAQRQRKLTRIRHLRIVHHHGNDGYASAAAQGQVDFLDDVVLVALLQMRGHNGHPLPSDQGDEHPAGGQMRPDLLEPSHSRLQRAMIKENVVMTKVLFELHVNRPRSALRVRMSIVDKDLQRSLSRPTSRHDIPTPTER